MLQFLVLLWQNNYTTINHFRRAKACSLLENHVLPITNKKCYLSESEERLVFAEGGLVMMMAGAGVKWRYTRYRRWWGRQGWGRWGWGGRGGGRFIPTLTLHTAFPTLQDSSSLQPPDLFPNILCNLLWKIWTHTALSYAKITNKMLQVMEQQNLKRRLWVQPWLARCIWQPYKRGSWLTTINHITWINGLWIDQVRDCYPCW